MSEYEHDSQEVSAVEQWETVEIQVRPRWPKVIGIISIVWGSLGLVCGGLGLVMLPFLPKLMSGAVGDDPVPYGYVASAADYAAGVIGFGLALLLLFAGIACVSHRPVTRLMHLVYGIVSIPIVVWSFMNHQHQIQQNIDWAKDYPNNDFAKSLDPAQNPAAGAGQLFGLVMLIVLGFGVPLFYLIWFGLIKTKPEQITGGDEGVY